MATRKRCNQSLFSSRRTERVVDKAVDAGIVLGTLYVGAGVLGAIAGAFKK